MMLSLSELARKLTAETGRSIRTFTVHEWTRRGIRGVLLPSRMIGGLRCIEWGDYVKWQSDIEKADVKSRSKKRMKARPIARTVA